MTAPGNGGIPTAADYLPDWAAPRFLIVEKQNYWTGAIASEVRSRISSDMTAPVFEHCASTRDALLAAELRNTIGIVLCLPGLEKEILGLLGRLSRIPHRQWPILAIGQRLHQDILPALMESGVQKMMVDIRDDLECSLWCLRVLGQRPGR